jgi:hypothetical protein
MLARGVRMSMQKIALPFVKNVRTIAIPARKTAKSVKRSNVITKLIMGELT